MKKIRFILLLTLFFVLQGCSLFTSDSDSSEGEVTIDLSLISSGAFLIDKGNYQSVNLNLNLQSPKDVYLIFTNTSNDDIVEKEDYTVSSADISFGVNSRSSMNLSLSESEDGFVDAVLPPVGKLIRSNDKKSENLLMSTLVDSVSEEDTGTFWEVAEAPYLQVPAQCRKVVSNVKTQFGAKTLNIWVADDCWSGGTKSNLITQAMVDAMADKFLKTGDDDDNDIYDWVTNICGEEWGSTSYSNLIGANQPIDILLCDIGNDNKTTGGVLGYFWSGNNFTDEVYSNEKVMFYIDAPIYGNDDGGKSGWNVDDPYPRWQISTLAHEFQHMINFYQLTVLKSVYQDTWLNEMLSMSIEDLVAYKLYEDYYSSPYYSRFLTLNENNYYSLGKWMSLTEYYAINYGFGSYLLRQCDGANFVKSIYNSGKEGLDAVELATGRSFATLMRNWGAAYMLSDQSIGSGDFAYNADLNSSLNGIDYELVNITAFNLYNSNGAKVEPKIYDLSNRSYINSLSNKYFLLKKDLPTGSYSLEIMMLDKNLQLTVVAK